MKWNKEESKEIKEINELEKKNECIVCKIVIPTKSTKTSKTIVYGNGGDIELAMLIDCMEDVIKSIKTNFPATLQILPSLKGKWKEKYKKIEDKN